MEYFFDKNQSVYAQRAIPTGEDENYQFDKHV